MASAAAGTKRPVEQDEVNNRHSPPRKRAAVQKSTPLKSSGPRGGVQAVSAPQLSEISAEAPHKQRKLPPIHKDQESKSTGDKAPIEQRSPKRPANDEEAEPARPRKRPGAAARISKEDKEAVLARQKQREEEALKAASIRGVQDAVRQHYNAVPQRGRDWRSTESRIKGLRKFNNWVKSTLIHRFSPPENARAPPIRVLDLGCGKGGDLGKWQSAPHPVDLYIGIDPAEVSIEQARERYTEMSIRGDRGGRAGRGGYRGGRPQRAFDAEFITQDAFGQSIANIPIVQNVGFAEGGGSRWGGGGFDVVSMMFCMHYAFENEAKARGMLANVAGSLKRGGRFLGVIPNSDVIRSQVEAFHKSKVTVPKDRHDVLIKHSNGEGGVVQPLEPTDKAERSVVDSVHSHDGSKALRHQEAEDNEASSLKRATPEADVNEVAVFPAAAHAENHDHLDVDKPEIAEWGNGIYKVRFSRKTPEDGVFRPPFGWKYNYFMEEAVEEVPEYVVPWEAFRA